MIVDLIELYIEKHLLALDPKTGKPKLRRGRYREQGLRRVVIRAWIEVESEKVTRSHIIDLVLAQKERRPNPRCGEHYQKRMVGGPFAAIGMYHLLHGMFGWFCEPPAEVSKEPLLPANPCPNTPERVHGVPTKDQKRKMLLRTSDELRAYWAAALRLPTPASQFFRVDLLTGQRRSQILKLRRDQVKEVAVPPIRTMLFGEVDMKMEEMHLCPLTGMVESILDELPVFEGSPWYFTYDGSRPFNSLDRYKKRKWMR
jgi:integrase